MHVGHVRNYTIGDAIARFYRMRGHNVLHPMGWDAFGLPAENYAIKNNISPHQAIEENTTRFKQQLTQMGFSYDWDREINSSDPAYYKWTQWMFLLLFKKGLAYQKESLQWWCETDKTVLANEQVEAGKCWRCGNEVTKKSLNQWFFKITDYADRLIDDLEGLDWSESIKSMQRNWIGRSHGAEISFPVQDGDEVIDVFTTRPDTLFGATFMVLAPEHPLVKKLTTRDQKSNVDAYIKQAQAKSDVERQDTDREKTGVFTGAFAINPVNNEPIPIWIADYVVYGYGTGAIMAVPGHDERDFAFAKKFDIPVRFVIEPTYGEKQGDETFKKSVFVVVRNPKDNTVIVLDWGPRQERHGGNMLIGGGVEDSEDYVTAAKREIAEETGYTNFKLVKESEFLGHGYFYSNTKHKNMQVSGRGLLFDLVDDTRGDTALDEGEKEKFKVTWQPIDKVASELDDGIHEAMYRYLVLDEPYTGEGVMVNSGEYDGKSSEQAREQIVSGLEKKKIAKSKLQYKIRDWLISRQRYWGAPIPIIHCGSCGPVPVPEDQLPVKLPEVETYQPTGDGKSPLARVSSFLKTDCPGCDGPAERETDTMDGFACSSWYFLRFADPHNDDQPFDPSMAKFWLPVDDYIGGAEHAVMHLLYARMWTKVLYDEGYISFDEPFKALRNQGMILAPDGRKMSKSWDNVIAPDDLIDKGYGADSIRLMELFIGPWDQSASWSIEGLGGVYRFLQRTWTLTQEYLASKKSDEEVHAAAETKESLERLLHKTIHKVSEDLQNMSFNTAIAAMMEYVNQLYKLKAAQSGFAPTDAWQETLSTLAKLLAPFAPHIAEELWQELGNEASIHLEAWPSYDPKLLVEDTVTIVVQVNGKVRANIDASADANKQDIIEQAKTHERVQAHLEGKEPKKTVVVPGRLVNFVI
jgi:leucyl-tRNA synthetase